MRGNLPVIICGVVAATALATAAPASAQQSGEPSAFVQQSPATPATPAHALAGPEAPHAGDAHGHADGHASHPHHVSVLLGAAHNGAIDETGFTLGAGYRYSLGKGFAVGPMADFAFYDSENTALVVAALFWKPVGNLLLVAGPGVEWVDHKGGAHEGEPHAAGSTHSEPSGDEGGGGKFAFRVGAGYEFHAGKLAIAPAVGADFVDGHTTMVYAVSFGFGF